MNNFLIESHPLGFFLPEKARILMLGSFPPPKERWSMNFYYPNIQNDMWRILGLIFFGDKTCFLTTDGKAFDEERVRRFCMEKGIAIGDTAAEVVRLKGNASDLHLKVVKPFPIDRILRTLPDCKGIVITGQKSMDTLLTNLPAEEPPVGGFTGFQLDGRSFLLFRMPSSSRAYPKPLEEKANIYREMFRHLGMVD
ncbi:uracil-DNA glycosylase family protein [Parabacteroides sp. Marseille-P3160]|uniref:uracil-DNA glycosylase family protein n=1 Tax=Parabacteroides sp. Marseille-P3160 TaxID=1917887 RepID=UPI0009BAD396|nr:uracil-DNA glycosylase family protein [Parabacteroides sp. Marseille-P3160]